MTEEHPNLVAFKDIKVGDRFYFYHSSYKFGQRELREKISARKYADVCPTTGVVGTWHKITRQRHLPKLVKGEQCDKKS